MKFSKKMGLQGMLDPTKISGAKLRVEVRFRHLKACKPQKWGEQSTIITKNGDELADMTTEELEAKVLILIPRIGL